jgi:hypothetical protein
MPDTPPDSPPDSPLGSLRFDYDLEYDTVTRTWAEIAEQYENWQQVAETYENWHDLAYSYIAPIGTATLPSAFEEIFYMVRLQVVGGMPPYTFELVEGEPPAGLEFDAAEGRIIGTAPEETAEPSLFVVKVTDEQEDEAFARFSLAVGPVPPPPPLPPMPAPAPAPPPRLRLVLDGGPDLNLDELPLLHITEVDYGYPEVREVVDDRPLADGTIDETQHFGSRVVTLTGKVAIDWQSRGRRQPLVDALAPFLRPGVRPWLYSRFDDGKIKRILLRADQFSRPQIANVQDISLSFKSPTGILEDANEQQLRLVPEIATQGRTYDLTFDRTYPSGSGTSWVAINGGNAPADWTAQIFGPCQAPAVVNLTSGEVVDLAGLTLAAGEFVAVSSRDHKVLADGLPESSRWGTVDYRATTWWQLQPGRNVLRFHCHWWETPAQMLINWRDTSLL